MKVLSWNCQGLGNPLTVRALKGLISDLKPDVIFLMETKKSSKNFYLLSSFENVYQSIVVDCTTNGKGKSGGLALLWNQDVIHIEIKHYDLNYIDFIASHSSTNITWRGIGIYCYSKQPDKFKTCNLIIDFSTLNLNPNWLVFRDFNIVLHNSEKLEGNHIDIHIVTHFHNTLNLCDLHDLGYKGDDFTWANNQQNNQHIKARLDRFIASKWWISTFPNYNNTHLLRFGSDHCHIMLNFSTNFHCRHIPKFRKMF